MGGWVRHFAPDDSDDKNSPIHPYLTVSSGLNGAHTTISVSSVSSRVQPPALVNLEVMTLFEQPVVGGLAATTSGRRLLTPGLQAQVGSPCCYGFPTLITPKRTPKRTPTPVPFDSQSGR